MTNHVMYIVFKMIRLSTILILLVAVTANAGGTPEGEEITGIVWEWQQTLYNNETRAVPDDPSNYTVSFDPGGKLYIRADCNRGGGNYAVEGKAIAMEVTHTTRAMCPPDSLERTFIKDLNAATIYFMRNGNLYIDLKYDTGTMQFGN
jgi:heat shock protein HslJ